MMLTMLVFYIFTRAAWVERGSVDERIRFGLHQSCQNRGSVGGVSVFILRWCGQCRWGLVVGRGLGPGSSGVGWCYVYVRCGSGLSV